MEENWRAERGKIIEKAIWGSEGEGGRYLGTTSGVLSSAAGDEFGIVVLEKVFIELHVFLFGQDGIVGFETVFGK